MLLLLIRHGESEADLLHVHEGRADFPLTARGRTQAAAMAAWVAERYRPERVFASTLRRARQTAEALAARAGCPIAFDDDLREHDNGLLAGLSFAEADRLYPRVPDLPPDASVYGQESLRAFRARAERALSRVLAGAGAEETVAVVSHGGMINQLYHALLGLPVADGVHFASGDTGVHVWRVEGNRRTILLANSTAHAEGL